ncbi:hypothetical protein [Aquiflexum lacus]|uniref:hypothetical protein n=1 Tax=Aquiflexum lacus TaxID=2483805 RepID=UPI0018942E95|nr:hypothetical protein [Aquiflexum lacus]
MIIIPNLFKDNLSLNTYSTKTSELEIVNEFLVNRKFVFEKTNVVSDSYGRKGQRFLILGNDQVKKFEVILKIKFKVLAGFEFDGGYESGSFTSSDEGNVDFDFENDPNEDSYCCKRINDRPANRECEEITAPDYYAAVLKCAMMANTKKWFAANTSKGNCP